MTKKMNVMLKLTKSFTLAMMLCIGMAVPALAGPVTGTEQDSAKAAVTKALKMGESVVTPNVTFTFELTPVSVNDAPATDSNMPKVVDKTVAFSASDTGSAKDGVKTIFKETESLFDGITWPHAGVYVYNVSEKQSVAETLSSQESIVFSQEKYKITVYVANGQNGLFVAAIGAEVTVTDGTPGTEAGHKVDAKPGGDPSIDGDYSKLVFTNTYMKNTGTGDPKDYTLVISKEVASDSEASFDFANRKMYFDFQVTVDKSGANANGTQKYKAYVMDEDGKVVTGKSNYAGTILTDPTYGDYIEFTAGQQALVHLQHGQWLSFVDLEVDAAYTVTELGKENFTPSCTQKINGKSSVIPGSPNASLTVPSTKITEGDDRADFVNTYKTLIPVGISVDNLPYAVLIGMGLAALMILILAKSRRKDNYSA